MSFPFIQLPNFLLSEVLFFSGHAYSLHPVIHIYYLLHLYHFDGRVVFNWGFLPYYFNDRKAFGLSCWS